MKDKLNKETSGIPVWKGSFGHLDEESAECPERKRPKPFSVVTDTFNRVIDKTFLGHKTKSNCGVAGSSENWKSSHIPVRKNSHGCNQVSEDFIDTCTSQNSGQEFSRIPRYVKRQGAKLRKSQSLLDKDRRTLPKCSKIPKRSNSVSLSPGSLEDYLCLDNSLEGHGSHQLSGSSTETPNCVEVCDPEKVLTDDTRHARADPKKWTKLRRKSCSSLQLYNGNGVSTSGATDTCSSEHVRARYRRSVSVIESIPEENEEEVTSVTPPSQNCHHQEAEWQNVEVKIVQIRPGSPLTGHGDQYTDDNCVVEEIGKSMIMVCRHPNCMEVNQERPYLLCQACDQQIHSSAQNGGHLVFDLSGQRRSVGTGALPTELGSPGPGTNSTDHRLSNGQTVQDSSASNGLAHSDSHESTAELLSVEWQCESEGSLYSGGTLDDTDGLYIKNAELDLQGNSIRASKFRRKKAVKARRHYTDLTHVTRRRSDIPPSSSLCPPDSKRRHSMDEPDPYTTGQRRGSLNVDLMNLMTGINHRKSESAIASLNPQTNQPSPRASDDSHEGAANSSAKPSPQFRRHSMYKVNINDELITVHIPMEKGKPPEMEIVAAIRNTTLRDAVFPLLERRRVDLSNISVFLDSSHTPLPWNCEIFLLGGKNLHVKNKDGDKVLSRVKGLGAQKIPNLRDGRPFKSVGHYKKHSSPTRNLPSKAPVHQAVKFRELSASISKHEHPLAQSCEDLPTHPSLVSSHLPVTDDSSVIYSRPGYVSEPGYVSDDDDELDNVDEHARRNSLLFRQRLLCEVKNEHPLARNHVRRSGDKSSQRSRRTNLSVDEGSAPHPASPHGSWSSIEKKSSRPQTKLQLLFNPPNKDREKQEQLNEILAGYSTNGLPSLPDLMRIPGQPEYQAELFMLEGHWSSLVANASSLTKRQHDQQEAIWELLQTEVQYIKSLKVITDLFACVLLNLQQELLLNEIETEKLFSNITQIYLANCKFWTSHFLTVLESARETRKPLDPSLMKDGFKKFADNFKPYTKYCLEQKPCLDYMKARYKDNDLFRCFVVWAEAQKQCNRLKLTDLLVKPMQRLTKYSLLLQAVLRKTEDDKQRRAILEMIGNVDRFVSHVNGELRKCHEQERLGAIISKIESYDAVEPPNDECKEVIQQYSDLRLWDPMPGCNSQQPRCVIIQSGLKLKDAQMRVDVECMLFTDMLLLCKASKRMDKFKVIKPPMRVDKIVVQELKDKGSFLLLYLNEYRVPVSAFTFHGDTASIRVWIEHIKKAQDLYNEAKMASMRGGGDPLFSSDASSNSPNSPSSFMGESLDSTTFIHARTVAPVASERPQPMRPRAYTVGGQEEEDGEEDETDYANSSRTLPREIAHVKAETSPLTVEVGADDSVSEAPAEDNAPSSIITTASSTQRKKVKQQSMSLPLSSVHPSEVTSGLTKNVFPPPGEDEAAKLKLNQRRTSRTERRYHTADAIREMERRDEDKDTSIHKRLSWNLGMVDINLEETRVNLKSKAFSSESLRSVHSSSGVSSTGSLHLSPDSEISEESETNSVKASPALGKSMNARSAENPANVSLDNSDGHSDLASSGTEDKTLSPEDKYSKSKSTSDIANLMSDLTTTQLKDGISSVELPRVGVNSKKLSYSQMLLVKKQLLLNSDIEASEV